MLKIRLRRMGSRHRPYYRIVVSDSRRAPSATALDEIGHYNPRDKTGGLSIDLERAESWIEKGARPSETVAQLIERARSAPAEAPAAEKTPAKKTSAEKTPAEQTPAEKTSETPPPEKPSPAAETQAAEA